MLEGVMTAIAVLCVAGTAVSLCRRRREYRHLERMLENFRSGRGIQENENDESWEGKLSSQLGRILETAEYKEQESVKEKEKMAALLSDLSHQLKTPLANVVMYTELLLQGDLTAEEEKGFLVQTQSQAQKMQWLIGALVRSSRLESGMLTFSSESQGLKETLAMSVSGVYAQAAQKRMEVVLKEFSDCYVWHNRKWTVEALGNVLENAIKYSPESSVVEIEVRPMELYTRVDVTDQGMGIAKEDYPKVFQRFWRSGQVREMEGNGLGLYLSQLILQKERGYITVESKLGRGSRFSLFFLNGERKV